tara:strand:+ start:2211 stop:2708 length:498 start_codon:yes stop_codon:yes gene_type:complete
MSRAKNKYSLTVQQESFCNYYVFGEDGIAGNATQSYIKSYNVGKNTKDATINHMACELMKNPNITKRIEMFQQELSDIWLNDSLSETRRIKRELWDIVNNKDKNPNIAVPALRLLAQATPDFFKDNTIKTEQNINIKDAMQDLDILITEISKDDNVIRLFNKDKD